ncbi:iron complex transport system permease protein [Symbiobacterium terraclitae]|uniref:Iron complex transport system permease protein n=1 Tax=Symbiobacterium terraclitae TaxID=557451 RepID=A0ABS4JPK2_9FIRM|nr:iron ABC transporter permease [Symbiobacterium terraclitae]MBP2017472.1 iron complex transport system permease protein [Symbiobacterium terraclitae]
MSNGEARPARRWRALILSGLFTAAVVLLSFGMGRYAIAPGEVLGILWQIATLQFDPQTAGEAARVLYYIRLPRILLAALTGVALAGAGTLFQGMFRNPLVSPDVLGVSSGAALGAAIGILLPGGGSIQAWAFCSGVAAVALTYGIARAARGQSVVMLVLAGMVVSAFFGAALSFLKYVADPYEQLPAIVFWLMGGFYRASWPVVRSLVLTVLPGAVLLLLTSWKLNILSLGDEEALSLGVNVRVMRPLLIAAATLMVAGAVSAAGTISWVGLVVPHIARMLAGADHDRSMPVAMLFGAGFMLLMDDLARSLTTAEIPVGILTSAIGAPFFGYLLITGRREAWR